MPIIESAKKKQRKDKKKTKRNSLYTTRYKDIVKKMRRAKARGVKIKQEDINKAYSAIDKALKAAVIHKNKAARLKAAVAKLVS